MAERSLFDLVDPSRRDGYARFKELCAFADDAEMPEDVRVGVRSLEIMTVAVMETANKLCDDYGLNEAEAISNVWYAVGGALGAMNAQCMQGSPKARRAVRDEMIKAIKRGYERGIVDIADPAIAEAK